MAGTIPQPRHPVNMCDEVSMESGLDGRNNGHGTGAYPAHVDVSMESGLDGRNNRVRGGKP